MTKYPLYLAPMEDVTDTAFRLMCKRFGADRVYTEFVNADALIRDVNSTVRKLTINPEERPVAIQIYGRDVDSMRQAAQIVEAAGPDILDINFGCPVKKVAGKGAGAGMLQNVPKMLEITRAVVDAVKIPVTVKTRLGWNDEHLHPDKNGNYFIVDLAEALQDCGIRELTIHGRTRAQMYTGDADWALIGAVKNNQRMHIPINGNGDVTTPERARECFDRYGVDAIMVGRATFGAPWVFSDMRQLLDADQQPIGGREMSMEWEVSVLREHVLRSVEWVGDERRGIVHSRRHFAASPTFKGLPNFKELRIQLLRAETVENVFALMDRVVAEYSNAWRELRGLA